LCYNIGAEIINSKYMHDELENEFDNGINEEDAVLDDALLDLDDDDDLGDDDEDTVLGLDDDDDDEIVMDSFDDAKVDF